MNHTLKKEDLRELKKVRDDNFRMLSLFSRYLNECPRAIKSELIKSLCEDGTDDETAFLSALIYIFDLDEEKERDREYIRKYLIPSVKKINVNEYAENEYGKLLSGIKIQSNEWMLKEEKYEPYELFPCGESNIADHSFAEYPLLSFFDKAFAYPSISQNRIEWMSLKPNEIETMKLPIKRACGNVTVFGLGLGYFAYSAAKKENVKQVTVIEKDKTVIDIFKKSLRPLFPEGEKINIINADAFDYMEYGLSQSASDYVFTDIWHDTSDGLLMYLKAKKYECRLPCAKFDYWIERSLLSRLRWMIFDEYFDPQVNAFFGLPDICSAASLYDLLREDSLRRLSERIVYNEK